MICHHGKNMMVFMTSNVHTEASVTWLLNYNKVTSMIFMTLNVLYWDLVLFNSTQLLFFCYNHSFILHCLESRTRPVLTPYDGLRRWHSNLHTPACGSPALPLCYGHRHQLLLHWFVGASDGIKKSPVTLGMELHMICATLFCLLFITVRC